MNQKKLFLLLCLSCLAGCHENPQECTDGSCEEEVLCTEGTFACSADNTPLVCQDNAYKRLTSCQSGTVCVSATGTCAAQPSLCTEGQKLCMGNTPMVCHNNTLEAQAACADGTYCLEGECRELQCLSGSKACIDNKTPQVCENEKWVTQAACNDGFHCSEGACVADPPSECTDGNRDCSEGLTPRLCVNGQWAELNDCADGFICSEGDCVPENPPECVENSSSCFNYHTPQTCRDGVWIHLESCADGKLCMNGSCEVPTCMENEKSCYDLETPQICLNDTQVLLEKCGDGLVCLDGECVDKPECEEGALDCENETTPKVCDNGKWVIQDECAEKQICEAGYCVALKPECEDGQRVCDEDTPKVCENGFWVRKSPCINSNTFCEEGVCKTSLKDGDACDDSFKTICLNDQYYQCLPRTKQIIVTDCKAEEGFSCTTNPYNQFCMTENGTARFTQADYEELDMFIENTLEKAGVYALSIGIIRDNKVVYKRGFGKTRFNDPDSSDVTEKTLFPVMSTTKNMTSYMAAKLVKEGYISWDDPIKKYLDEFKSTDDAFTKTATIRQGLSHSTGIKGRDDSWYSFPALSPEEMVASFHDPVGEPGVYFDYSNQMYATAGYSAIRSKYKDGSLFEAFEQAIQDYVFDPLGMTSSTVDYRKATAPGMETARPVQKSVYGVRQIEDEDFNTYIDAIGPAGAAYSNVDDMMKYLYEQLNNTDPEQLARREEIILNSEASDPDSDLYVWYGLGTEKDDIYYYNRYFRYSHDGGMSGAYSRMVYYPDLKLGISMLANNSFYTTYYLATLIEYKTGLQAVHPQQDYSLYVTLTDAEWTTLKNYDDIPSTDYIMEPSTEQVNFIVGKYTSSSLGDALIRFEDNHLIFEYKDIWEAEIHYYADDPDFFCFTSNPSRAEGLCGYLQPNATGEKAKSFVLPYNEINFYHVFARTDA